MVDLAPISFYPGLEILRDREKETIKLLRPEKILGKFHLEKANVVNTAIKEGALPEQRTEGEASLSEKWRDHGISGSLMFSMVDNQVLQVKLKSSMTEVPTVHCLLPEFAERHETVRSYQ